MKMEMYVAPEVECLEVIVEKGYAATGGAGAGGETPDIGGPEEFDKLNW